MQFSSRIYYVLLTTCGLNFDNIVQNIGFYNPPPQKRIYSHLQKYNLLIGVISQNRLYQFLLSLIKWEDERENTKSQVS